MTETIGVDIDALSSWLQQNRPELISAAPLSITRLHGGLSNLTYRIDGGTRTFVLRRPPLGHVQATAHDMAREFRVISGLATSSVPVPGAILIEDDRDDRAGVGTPFYLMDFVDGSVLASTKSNRDFEPRQLRALSFELVQTLAALHGADPAALGLAELGRADGFLERQLRRWATQYKGSASRELPALDRLQTALGEAVPVTRFASLVHGDFRLDNAIVKRDSVGDPHVAAILDWEMATIGDSLTDLGLLGLYWDIRTVAPGAAIATNSSVDPAAGYPAFTELVDEYAEVRRIQLDDLEWYIAFAAYKLAIIVEGIHFRYIEGKTVGGGFEHIGSLVDPLAQFGLRRLAQDTYRRTARSR